MNTRAGHTPSTFNDSWKKRLWAMLAIAVLPPVLASCAMVDSQQLSQIVGDTSCIDDGGAYFLSKGVLKVKVEKTGEDVILDEVSVRAVPDRRHAYCLNFRSSPLHDEKLHIIKTNGILQQISSIAVDRTPEIVDTLVETVFSGLSRDPTFGRAVERGVFQQEFLGEFDPFDEKETALLNDSLNDFGICLLLQEADWASSIGFKRVANYCEDPIGFLARRDNNKAAARQPREAAIMASEFFKTEPTASPIVSTRGVLYRPRLTYTLMVYVKNNVKARYIPGKSQGVYWNLRKQKSVALENIAPIMSVGVDRTFFAKRKTTLAFNAGALVDIDIAKESELAGFVSIPLTIANAIVKLPTKILQVKVNNTNNRAKLIEAQTQLINLEHQRRLLAGQVANNAHADQLINDPGTRSVSGTTDSFVARSPIPGLGQTASLGDAFRFGTEAQCKTQCASSGTALDRCASRCSCIFLQCVPFRIGRSACESFCSN